MKLVLIHGRSQGQRNEKELREEWIAAWHHGCEAAGSPIPGPLDVRVPFYGAVLDELSRSRQTEVTNVLERGGGDGTVVDPFVADLIDEIRKREGIADSEVRAELGVDAQERGPANWEWVQAAGRLLSSRIPWLTEQVLARFVADVDAYLKFPQQIDAIVRSDIENGPGTVVVGHSLGTVVGYRVLAQIPDTQNVSLYCTLGSPLGIKTIKRKLQPPIGVPRCVRVWLNASDERDGVALYSRLDRDNFCAGIENISDLRNPRERPHWIGGYLADPEVARRVAAALEGSAP